MKRPASRRSWILVASFAAAVTLLGVAAVVSVQAAGRPVFPPAKQAALDREAAAIAAARAAPQPSKTERKQPDVRPDPPIQAAIPRTPAGRGQIIETGFGPFGPEFMAENRWVEGNDADGLAVYAGATRSDPMQGLIAVFMAKLHTGRDGWYPTPTKAGSVHVVNAVDERITLAARDGTTFVFDVPTRQFVQQ